jgi:hypothetical protein
MRSHLDAVVLERSQHAVGFLEQRPRGFGRLDVAVARATGARGQRFLIERRERFDDRVADAHAIDARRLVPGHALSAVSQP